MDRHGSESHSPDTEMDILQDLLHSPVTAKALPPANGHSPPNATLLTPQTQDEGRTAGKQVNSPEDGQPSQGQPGLLAGKAAHKSIGAQPGLATAPSKLTSRDALAAGSSVSPVSDKSRHDGCAGTPVITPGGKHDKRPVQLADQVHSPSHPAHSQSRSASPNYGSPQQAPRHYASAQHAAPHYGSPRHGSPRHGSPQHGSPHFASPHCVTPQYVSPHDDSPPCGSPHQGSPLYASLRRPRPSLMPNHHLDTDSPSPGDSRRPGPANARRRQAVDYHGFEALYKENRALLEEVEARKREEKPRKSMFKRGVQTLLSVPDGQPIFPGFKAGAAKVGSLFAIEGPFRRQPARVLSTGGTDSVEHQPEPSFTRLATVIVVGVVVLLVASMMLLALLDALAGHRSGVQAHVCRTSDCRLHALYLSYRQNHSVRPCDDFQAYVCSEWEPPVGYSLVANTTISEVVVRWMHEMRHALQDSMAGGIARRKVLSMLDSCMADSKSTHDDALVFREFMHRLNLHWPGDPPTNVSALSVLIRLAFKWQLTLWMKLRVTKDPVRRYRRRLVLTGGDEDAIVFLNINHKQLLERDAYVQYWKSHYAILYRDDDVIQNHVVTQMYESATLQSHVIETLLAVLRNYPKSPVSTTVGKLGNNIGGRLTSSLWLQFLREHVNPHSDVPVSEDMEVLVPDLFLLKSIGGLFAKYSDGDIIRQLSWEFVQLHVLMMDKTPLDIAFSGRWYAMPYVAVYCARYVETVYRPLLASIYVRLHLNVDDRRALDSDVAGLVNAVIEKVNTSSWFEEQGKQEAMEKLRAVRTSIWPPEAYLNDDKLVQAYHWLQHFSGSSFTANWFESFSMLRDINETDLYAATVDLHNMMSFVLFNYDYLTNSVHVAISALTNPVYYPHGSRSMFYGGLGFLYTGQLFKSIDDTGRRVRADGTVTQPWPLSHEGKIARKSQCRGAHHDFLADLGALEIAHAEFLATYAVDGGKVVSKSYTEEQVFFLTVCRILCELPHAQFSTTTCNSLLRNSPEFAEAFHCPLGSPMNPEEKCQYYASSEN